MLVSHTVTAAFSLLQYTIFDRVKIGVQIGKFARGIASVCPSMCTIPLKYVILTGLVDFYFMNGCRFSHDDKYRPRFLFERQWYYAISAKTPHRPSDFG